MLSAATSQYDHVTKPVAAEYRKCHDGYQNTDTADDSERIAQSLVEIYSLLPQRYSGIEEIQNDPVLILENAAEFLGELLNSQLDESNSFDITKQHPSWPGFDAAEPHSSHSVNCSNADCCNESSSEMKCCPVLLTSPPCVYHVDATEDVRSGFRDCSDEVIRFLVQSENLSENDPIVVGLKKHLLSMEESLETTRQQRHFCDAYYDEQHTTTNSPFFNQCFSSTPNDVAFTDMRQTNSYTDNLVNIPSQGNSSDDVEREREVYRVTSELLGLLKDYTDDEVNMDEDDYAFDVTESEQ